MELADYEFEIIHRPGILNSAADALSRIDISRELILSLEPIPNKVELKYEKAVNITTRNKARNEEHEIQQHEFPSHIELDTSLTEIDILYHKSIHGKDAFRIYVITDAFTFPFSYVNDDSIFNGKPGKIKKLSDTSITIYESNTISYAEKKSIWNSIKNKLIAENHKQIFIFASQSDVELYSSLKSIILNIFHKSGIKVNLISNQIILLEEEEDQNTVIKSFHDNILGGHLGIQATIDKIKKQYFWPDMGKQIKEYINNCITCKANKIGTHTKMPMHITSTASAPFEKIIMDCVGPIPESRTGNRFMVTFQDDLTKFAECVCTPNILATTVAQAFVESIVCRHGLPKTLLTDNGTNFMSDMFQQVCRLLKINHITSTVAHPQTVGQIERYHRTLGHFLKIFTDTDKDSWDELVPYALFVYYTIFFFFIF